MPETRFVYELLISDARFKDKRSYMYNIIEDPAFRNTATVI